MALRKNIGWCSFFIMCRVKTREIAQILELNENTVRGRLATAREKLEKLYQKGENRHA
jgi:DNA-directed RNA polymerase specialized sigma24 family protein